MRHSWLIPGIVFLVAMHSPPGSASIAELQSSRHLEISSELIPSDDIIPGQRIELVITIATDRWFTGGTRLEIPEIPGLVILQTNEFASNSSNNRGGHSWVIQRWTLDVFPQREGSFSIPAITARVKVSDLSANSVEGKLSSPGLHFNAVIPQSLARVAHWVAAPKYQVSQRFDKDLDNLQIGDAFTRKITFEAADVMAMMLPAFDVEIHDGLAAYPEPPTLNNSSNRGDMNAKRIERISYIVEAPGQYRLPARDYFWWDTRTGELQMRFLPAIDISVGKAGTDNGRGMHPTRIQPLQWTQAALGIFAGVIFIWLLRRWLPRVPISRITTRFKKALRWFKQLRKPALPDKLNPDSSAGE